MGTQNQMQRQALLSKHLLWTLITIQYDDNKSVFIIFENVY